MSAREPTFDVMGVDLCLTRQAAGPEENQLSCLFCRKRHGVEWETSFRPQGTGALITAGVCESCRTRLQPKRPVLLGSDSDEQAALYWKALEDLTCGIEPVEGAEEGIACATVCRRAADILYAFAPSGAIRDDIIKSLRVLQFRFEEILDREDLKL